MPNPWFQFKQFIVWHDKCGMKVGTDGVLLGAWAKARGNIDVLDIGAGTGLVSLMIAQRTTGNIDAVEIDEDACYQMAENFTRSSWKERLTAHQSSIQNFAEVCSKKYDLIVSNPPFFQTSLKSPDLKRAQARHSDTLSLRDLAFAVSRLLKPEGKFAVILPIELKGDFITELATTKFWLTHETKVIPYPGKSPVRVLIETTKINFQNKQIDELVVRDSPAGKYTEAFRKLTSEYYMTF
jgi:tRNA1Val (adenine37-N6)-methyltransferase